MNFLQRRCRCRHQCQCWCLDADTEISKWPKKKKRKKYGEPWKYSSISYVLDSQDASSLACALAAVAIKRFLSWLMDIQNLEGRMKCTYFLFYVLLSTYITSPWNHTLSKASDLAHKYFFPYTRETWHHKTYQPYDVVPEPSRKISHLRHCFDCNYFMNLWV